MNQWLIAHYDLWRGLHILAVIAWMAGLLYLPRLFAYHTRATSGSELDLTFRMMEAKLLKIIMGPALLAALVFGALLLNSRGWDTAAQPWMIVKLLGVAFLFGWHGYLERSAKRFAAGTNTHSEKFWRMTNELPFLAAIVMVMAVTLEFGSR